MVMVKLASNLVLRNGEKRTIIIDYANLASAINDLKEGLKDGEYATISTSDDIFMVIKLKDKLYKCDEVRV